MQRHDCGGPAPQWAVRVQTACPGWSSASLAGAIRWRAGGRGLPTGACPPPQTPMVGCGGPQAAPGEQQKAKTPTKQNKAPTQTKHPNQAGGWTPASGCSRPIEGRPAKKKTPKMRFSRRSLPFSDLGTELFLWDPLS